MTGTYGYALAVVLVQTGFWPANVPFDTRELSTVVKVLEEQGKQARRAR